MTTALNIIEIFSPYSSSEFFTFQDELTRLTQHEKVLLGRVNSSYAANRFQAMLQNDALCEFLLYYPGLVNESSTRTTEANACCFKGTVKIESTWYRLNLRCPNFPKIEQFELKVQQLHKTKTFSTTSNGVDSNWTVYDLIHNVPKLIEQNYVNSAKEILHNNNHILKTNNIFAEVAALYAPESYQMHVNHDSSRIRFSKFTNYEQHYLEIQLPALKLLEHSLPDCMPWQELFAQTSYSLGALVKQFEKYLEELQPFYENFVDIDELCDVVQPAKPTTKHNWRLFVLRKRVFLKLILADPFAPIASMSVHIIGPTYELEHLRRVYSEGIYDWDADLDIHKNLLRIFDLCFFPMRTNNGVDNLKNKNDLEEQFCNICYCYDQDNGNVPIVSCDNPHCSLIYHASCLKEWFNTLSDGKIFLDVSLGTCPFCKAKLSTSFTELMEN